MFLVTISRYGTVRSDLDLSNVHTDNDGRVIIFSATGCSWGNFYLPSEADRETRAKRESYFSTIIPHLMIRRIAQGAAGGNFNPIIAPKNSSRNGQPKISLTCRIIVGEFLWLNSFWTLYPRAVQYSRHSQTVYHGDGATQLDMAYHWGDLQVLEAEYQSISFSDHLGLRVSFNLPN